MNIMKMILVDHGNSIGKRNVKKCGASSNSHLCRQMIMTVLIPLMRMRTSKSPRKDAVAAPGKDAVAAPLRSLISKIVHRKDAVAVPLMSLISKIVQSKDALAVPLRSLPSKIEQTI